MKNKKNDSLKVIHDKGKKEKKKNSKKKVIRN